MRKAETRKEQTRNRILECALQHFKEEGFFGSGVKAVMKSAGLTHGGFYAHFRNKDELIRETVRTEVDRLRDRWGTWLQGKGGRSWIEGLVDLYLSPEHVEHVREGCLLPSLAADIARADAETREAFGVLLGEWAHYIEDQLGYLPGSKDLALSLISQSVGAISLARASEGTVAREILVAARENAYATIDRFYSDAEVSEGGTPFQTVPRPDDL